MYPRLKMNKRKITENTRAIISRAKTYGIDVTAITKCTGGNVEIAQAFLDGGAAAIGDSRIQNLKNLAMLPCEKWLIRIPMISESNETVAFANLSLNSEMKTIRSLNLAAKAQGKTHGILLMLDLGDLREGYFIGDGRKNSDEINALISESLRVLDCDIQEILTMKNIKLRGIGTNATCVGATIPIPDSFPAFFKVKQLIEEKYQLPCEIISGGNSSAWYLIENASIPVDINNLRLGDVILFGRESAYFHSYDYLHQDAFILDIEIIEIRSKPSYPIGEIGRNAFGDVPVFADHGIRRRAICALGRQDTEPEHLFPLLPGIKIESYSSDHLILDITDAPIDYVIGDIVSLRCDYMGALYAATSEYVEKIIIND
ncbi:alanine racemase [Acetobacterium bakii]|uniref:Alanine racemase n=2 Tax=Acetobacterium bakii TaxID=52689 RepID=A0A0L6TZ15_9FIRM|nr:alanine/ornithine racemase family PLP-dependent enzyme [Acetobacterium bakii]KNZ40805.1 alanine racemase [Acetobacterium bakii]